MNWVAIYDFASYYNWAIHEKQKSRNYRHLGVAHINSTMTSTSMPTLSFALAVWMQAFRTAKQSP